jgi:phage terminase large subunit-like protein
VKQYALEVTEGREIAGPMVRAACRRHLADLESGETRGLWWDLPAAEHAIGFFRDVLHLSGGNFEGKPFRLEPAQQFIVGSLFGWRNTEGQRRFRLAYVEMGKGAGKSPMAAGIGLYMMCATGEVRAEVYSAAVDKDQAKILFRDAVVMVDQSPALARRIVKSGGKDGDVTKVWNLAYLEKGSFFRPISSESQGRGKSGFRPYCVLLDEIHEHPTDAMVEFTRKNLKGRPNALALMITNAGVYDTTSVCFRYHDYAERVLLGAEQDDQFFAYVCGLDKDDQWTDPAVWKKACPLLGVTIPKSYLEQEVRESLGMPSKQSLTRRLNFCEWTESLNPFVAPEVWNKNSGMVADEDLVGRLCYGGLDLSMKNDLSALVLAFPLEDETCAIRSFFWTPQEGIKQRADQDRAPYVQWVHDGYLTATSGKSIDYRWIAQTIGTLTQRYDIRLIAFDPWRIDDMVRALEDERVDLELEPHAQGFKEMTPSIEALEDALLEGKLRHGGHPVLSWCIHNTQVERDPAGNRKLNKRKATGRIDGTVALAMACGVLARKGGGQFVEGSLLVF